MNGARKWRVVAGVLPALLLGVSFAAAAEPGSVWPRSGNTVDVLASAPAYQAAWRAVGAEESVHRQYLIGPHEWTGTVSAARRTQSSPTPERSTEWEVGLERALRLPGKSEAFDRAGQARVAQARAAAHKVWREQARLLLERQGTWLRERESARVWAVQVGLFQQQLETVAKRQRLGDAARIEQEQAEAALVQAQAQAQAASGRANAARTGLERLFPGVELAPDAALPAPQGLEQTDAQWIAAQLEAHPELELARAESATAETQSKLDAAETRADPTLGLRYGRARNGAENMLGVVLSIPFGGDYRAAGAAATASRAAAAALRRVDAELRAQADAAQRLHEARTAYVFWQGSADAAQRLARAADSLQRGYQLGSGNLGDVLSARRLANEQQLSAAGAAVDAWVSQYRLELEANRLWAEPSARR
jgi:outer membrane protein TolC